MPRSVGKSGKPLAGAAVLAVAMLGATPALAADITDARALPQATVAPAVPLPSSAAVGYFYQTRNNALIWFRAAGPSAAASQLVAVLQRAPMDGLANGPQLAAQAEAAIARGQGTDAAARLDADRLLSAMWVQYVQSLQRPVAGVIFGDKYLMPRLSTPERILMQAAQAPSLEAHLSSVSSVNPIYAQLRAAAWSQSIAAGGAPPDARLRANLDRARILPSKGRYLIADIATQRLFMFEDGNLQDSMKVIVGKRDYQTPMMASTMHYATFNPYWNIPKDVVKRSVAPLVVKRGVGYLKTSGFEVVSDWTDQATAVPADQVDWKAVAAGEKEVRIRQLPGRANMMGQIKFGFANDYGIYLHDTPLKGLFAKDRRTLSLGCVRVEDAKRLAKWLLRRDPVAPSAEPEQHVQLPKPVSIYLTYLTAQADSGQIAFADDIYGLDGPVEARVATATASTAAQ